MNPQLCPVCKTKQPSDWLAHVHTHSADALALALWQLAGGVIRGRNTCPVCRVEVRDDPAYTGHLVSSHDTQQLARAYWDLDWIVEMARNGPAAVTRQQPATAPTEPDKLSLIIQENAALSRLVSNTAAGQTERLDTLITQLNAFAGSTLERLDGIGRQQDNQGAELDSHGAALDGLNTAASMILDQIKGVAGMVKAGTVAEARIVMCPLCGMHLDAASLYDHIVEDRCDVHVTTAPGALAVDTVNSYYIPVNSPAADLLNYMAWYIRAATEPDTKIGYSMAVIDHNGPAYKLLAAMNRYIAATVTPDHTEDTQSNPF